MKLAKKDWVDYNLGIILYITSVNLPTQGDITHT